MTSPNGEFLDLNAQARRHPNIVKLRSGVVRRTSPEPDRSHVESVTAAAPPAAAEKGPEPVAKKKTRTRLSDSDKIIALSRVESLVSAGEEVGKACRKVAKEFGASALSLARWRKERRANGKKSTPPPAKAAKKNRSGVEGYPPNTPMPVSIAGERLLELIDSAIEPTVRRIVREEIRRMLS